MLRYRFLQVLGQVFALQNFFELAAFFFVAKLPAECK